MAKTAGFLCGQAEKNKIRQMKEVLIMEQIKIFDTTLRDGEQTPGINLNIAEKLALAKQLERLGVDVIEAGFPASSKGDQKAVKKIAQELKDTSVCGLCRALPADIDACWQAIQGAADPRIHIFLATSPIHMQYKLRKTPQQVLEAAAAAVAYGKKFCSNIEFSAEDAFRSDPAFLYQVLEQVIAAGATTVNVPDTVGYATPEEYGRFIAGIVEHVPNIHQAVISVHCHNDLGLAVANSLAGVAAGARQIECTMNGLGERAGNASLEEIVMGLEVRKDYYDFCHRIDTKQIYRTSKLVESLTAVDIASNKPIIGTNAFRHESGIHQHGMLTNPQTYEIMTPESIGKIQSDFVLGKHSGRHAFALRLEELGFRVDNETLEAAFEKFKALADRKKQVTDEDISALVEKKSLLLKEHYKLHSFQIQTGNKITSIAGVNLIYQDRVYSEAAVGDGPIDAIFHAVDKIVGQNCTLSCTLESYGIRAVTEGKDALGEVTVKIKFGDRIYTGKGLSTDILESSILSYINAINRAISDQEAREQEGAEE